MPLSLSYECRFHAQAEAAGHPAPGSFFAKIGVPALYAKSGVDFIGRPAGWGAAQARAYEANRYHQPSDEIDASWELSGAVEDARLFLLTALRVANARGLPAWPRGDEFEAARKAAVRAVAP